MTSQIASLLALLGICGLFLLDEGRRANVTRAVWLPVLWLAIGGSRMVSLWLGLAPLSSADQVLDGSPLDRNILLLLTTAGTFVLIGRRQRVAVVLAENKVIFAFFLYCGITLLWSDYPFVGFKRWIKACGDLVMVLVIVTEPHPVEATQRLLARLGFLLIPTSILLIRYYSELGRGFDAITGEATVFGVTTGKNLLGMICMIAGLGAVWRLLLAWRGRRDDKPAHRRRSVIAQLTLLAMSLWLFWQADSMTSFMCFVLGSAFIVATGFGFLDRTAWLIHVSVASALGVVATVLLMDVGGGVLEVVGRDPTLTGRTEIWGVVKEFAGNPWVGTGFESFWLGDRLEAMWAKYWWHPNEAHCGYLDVFLTLGWVGLLFLVGVIAAGYGRVIRQFRHDPVAGSLALAIFVAVLAYNVTETAFRYFHPLWVLFLLAVIGGTPPSEVIAAKSIGDRPALGGTRVLRSTWRTADPAAGVAPRRPAPRRAQARVGIPSKPLSR
jgi:exopolysaccharide production protein ExoQ